MNKKIIKVGNVVYSPKVTVIWEMIEEYMKEKGFEMENVFFKDYPTQIDALVANEIDIAWNAPLAHVDAQVRTNNKCKVGVMRDTDQDRTTFFIVKKDSNINSLEDLKSKKIGFTEINSSEGRLIPINYLSENGLKWKEGYTEINYNFMAEMLSGIPKTGLSITNALKNDEVDCIVFMDLYWVKLTKDGTIDGNEFKVIAKTPLYDHCIFTTSPDLDLEVIELWDKLLLEMDYNNENHKTMMDLEGLKEWKQGREEGFKQLVDAVKLLGYF